MPLATTGELITDAAAEHRAVAAFNVITLEHVEAVIAGARRSTRRSCSRSARTPSGSATDVCSRSRRAAGAAAERAAVPVALHLDHVHDDDLLRQAPVPGSAP